MCTFVVDENAMLRNSTTMMPTATNVNVLLIEADELD